MDDLFAPCEVIDAVAQLAPLYTTVLIIGETGTGRERLAREIHARSTCRTGPFVRVTDGRPPLGSGTGGTLYLHNIDGLPLDRQRGLLEALDHCDARLLASTRVDLTLAVARDAFLAPLYETLSAALIELPPLRRRRAEIPPIAQRMLVALSDALGRTTPALSKEASCALISHPWPANLRELRNVLERAALLASSGQITSSELLLGQGRAEFLTLRELELDHIGRALELAGGNKSHAARLLGISRTTLYEKLAGRNKR